MTPPPRRLLPLAAAALRLVAVRPQSPSQSYIIPAVPSSQGMSKQEVVELQPVDATIRGVVYLDDDRDGVRDGDEGPVTGAVVKLFDCSTGRRVGIARTDDDGSYGITVTSDSLPSGAGAGSRGCFYVQYTVPGSVVAGSAFSTPLNGETDDVYLGAGDRLSGLEAGVYRKTPEPTSDWTTPAPSGGTPLPTGEIVPLFAPTGRPTTAGPTAAPATGAPSGAPAGMPQGTGAPHASLPMVLLPVPEDAVSAATPPVDEATGEDTGEGAGSDAAPSTGGGDFVWDRNEDASTAGGDFVWDRNEDAMGVVLDEEGVEEPTGATVEPETAAETMETEGRAGPDVDAADAPPSQPDAVEDGGAGPNGSDAGPAPLTGPMDVSAVVTVRLDGLGTMDGTARTAFEGVCADFLSGVLGEFETPIRGVGCAVVGQTASGRRRGLVRRPPRTRRRRLQGGTEVELEVSGTVDRTEGIQRPGDVRLGSLLVGVFNVQGYLFADALREDSEAFRSLSAVSGVQSPDDGLMEGAQVAGETTADGWYEVFTTPAGMAGAAAGGAVLLCLAIVAAGRSRRRKRRLREEEYDLEEDPEVEGGKRPVPVKRPTQMAPVNSPGGDTRSTASPASSSSVRSLVSPCSSGEVEVSLPVPRTRPRPPSLRDRVRRDVMTPPGKLGIMVANTNSHGPAVHTVRPGSAMEGLVYVNDIIVSVNDVDTTGYTAAQITRVMRETVGEERKITLLSAHR